MVKLSVVNSNSHGNAYALQYGEDVLLIEAGMPLKKLLPFIDWRIDNVTAIATHAHFDHVGYVKQYLEHNIRVYSTPECADKYKGVKPILPKNRYRIGSFIVKPLLVPHNAECYSYVVDLPNDEGRLLFITDASDFPYKVPNVNFLCLETNYCESKLITNASGDGIPSRPEHHMSLDKAIEIAKRHFNPDLKEIVCLHLSDGNSDENEIKDTFYKELGIKVKIAEPGLEVELIKEEF
jgi:phosphoribosyl 1,2-cyclic phosphodiesterase